MSEELKNQVLHDKYFLKDDDGNLLETKEEQIWDRVSTAIASVEEQSNKKKWQKEFHWLLENWKFVPGGRILFGAGNTAKKRVTNLNCYFINLTGDSIEGIYKCLSETARTLAMGGGVGTDLSILRPDTALVRNSAKKASGIVPIAEMFSQTSGLIGQHGRIGALILTLHCNHPDVFNFIKSKDDVEQKSIRFANLSILITDKLMQAVESDEDFDLWYPDIVDDCPDDIKSLISGIKGYIESCKDSDKIAFYSGSAFVNNVEMIEKIKNMFSDKKITFIYNGCEQFYNYNDVEWFVFYSSSTNEFEIRRKRIYSTIKALDLWNTLIEHAHKSAEPGVLFYDIMRRNSTSEYNGMNIMDVNPCSETLLDPMGCCCLGSINLSSVIVHEFTEDSAIDQNMLERLIRCGVRFLDNVLDYNKGKHPLFLQELVAMRSRRIGLGVTGLADMLCKLRLKYDTKEAVTKIDDLFKFIRITAYNESEKIANEKGNFLTFDSKLHFRQRKFQQIDNVINCEKLRNVSLLSMPPVGSGSLLTQTSSGIEPIFAVSYTRRSESLGKKEFKIYHPLVKEYMKKFNVNNENNLPNYFVTADKINYEFRVLMQSTIQKYTCQSISSTLNLPENASVDIVKNVYTLAWKNECNGITVYRQGSRQDILSDGKQINNNRKMERNLVADGKTAKVKLSNYSVYVTLNVDEKNNPIEVFVNLGKSGSDEKAMTEALGRLISLHLRCGGKLRDVIETMLDIRGSAVQWWSGTAIYSLPDLVSKALLYMHDVNIKIDGKCPQCKNESLRYENGCRVCMSCGYSQC